MAFALALHTGRGRGGGKESLFGDPPPAPMEGAFPGVGWRRRLPPLKTAPYFPESDPGALWSIRHRASESVAGRLRSIVSGFFNESHQHISNIRKVILYDSL